MLLLLMWKPKFHPVVHMLLEQKSRNQTDAVQRIQQGARVTNKHPEGGKSPGCIFILHYAIVNVNYICSWIISSGPCVSWQQQLFILLITALIHTSPCIFILDCCNTKSLHSATCSRIQATNSPSERLITFNDNFMLCHVLILIFLMIQKHMVDSGYLY